MVNILNRHERMIFSVIALTEVDSQLENLKNKCQGFDLGGYLEFYLVVRFECL